MTELATQGRVTIAQIVDVPLSVDDALAAVSGPGCGGVVLFVGTVRQRDHERDVVALDYSAHPTATDAMTQVCRAVAERHPESVLAAIHRVGELRVGDLAVVVAAAAPHRDQAFAAARDLIDTLKSSVPIWKHQQFLDGSNEWVGSP